MAHLSFKANPVQKRQFMPATQSLAAGLVSAAIEDLLMLLTQLFQLLQQVWKEIDYSTAQWLRR